MDKKTVDLLLNSLRKASITWSGRRDCLKKSRKKTHDGEFTKNGKPKYKFMWQCAKCLIWSRDQKSMEVDHLVEVGPFTGDWNEYISRLFCDQSNLQCLCVKCHSMKTSAFNARLMFKRKSTEGT